MKSDTEIGILLKTIRAKAGQNAREASRWYGKDSLAMHAYRNGVRDALKELDKEIEKLEAICCGGERI